MNKQSNRGRLLDGQVFNVEMLEKGNERAGGEPSTVVFSDGAFVSSACLPFGFNPSEYSARREKDGAIGFRCEVRGADAPDAVHTWKGKVSGNEIEGEMTWAGSDGVKTKFTFKGTKTASEAIRETEDVA